MFSSNRKSKIENRKSSFFSLLLPAAAVGFAALYVLEGRRPLRGRRSSRGTRVVKNAELGAITGAAIQLIFLPIIMATARFGQRRQLGLVRKLDLPRPLETLVTIVLLDYTYYIWHWMLHRSSFLWRFHAVHHTDIDLDVSTSIRFHLGEWILSTPFRAAQTLIVGASERLVALFEASMLLSIMFHHSNLRLPAPVDRILARFIVTPRMHGIHHSIRWSETNSNYSTLLTLWDRVHGTLDLDTPQDELVIGLPAYQNEEELTFGRLLRLPFERNRQTWLLLL